MVEGFPPKGDTIEDIISPNSTIIVEDEEALNGIVVTLKIEEPVVPNAGAREEEESKEKKGIEEEEVKEKYRGHGERMKNVEERLKSLRNSSRKTLRKRLGLDFLHGNNFSK